MSDSVKHVFTVGALGDSITTAFNADRPGDNALHSWATGSDEGAPEKSHFRRLAQLYPTLSVRSVNVAVAGSRAADLHGQVDRLVRETPDYVTLLIGANDLPQWLLGEAGTLLDLFVRNVREAAKRLIAANPRVMILLVAVPDQSLVLQHVIPNIAQLQRTYRTHWRRLNQALAEIAAVAAANVRYCSSPAATPIPMTHLSALDRYHPSVAGQRALAAMTWKDGFFPAG